MTKAEYLAAIRERLKQREYDRSKILEQEQILFEINGENIGSIGNFITFSGLPKSGKSLFLSATLASTLLHHPIFSIELKPAANRPIIGYFDTEQTEHDFYRHIDRIKKFSGKDILPETLKLYRTREDSAKMNLKLIKQFLEDTPQCSVLFIDGLLDLIINYNDETESRKLIQWLKTITQRHNILVVTVLHTSKSGEQRLGHLGAGVDRYSQSVLEVVKDKQQYILKQKFLRSSIGFDDIIIQYSKETGNYIQTSMEETSPFYNWQTLFDNNRRLTYAELVTGLKQITNKGDNYCKRMITELKQNKEIEQDKKGNYFLIVNF